MAGLAVVRAPRLLSLTDGREPGSAGWTASLTKNTFIHIAPPHESSDYASKDDFDLVYDTYPGAMKVPEVRPALPGGDRR